MLDLANNNFLNSRNTKVESSFDHPLMRSLLNEPTKWRIWPAIAAIRWLLSSAGSDIKAVYKSHPSLAFQPSEIVDLKLTDKRFEIILAAPGLATIGSALPYSDIDRIIRDQREKGALNIWLDGFVNRLMHILEESQTIHNAAYALATSSNLVMFQVINNLAGRSAPLSAETGGRLISSLKTNQGGSIGFIRAFVHTPSASGISSLITAFTNLPVTIKEFTGARIEISEPACLGKELRAVLGSYCYLPTAGFRVTIEGGSNPEARAWAQDPIKRQSLLLLVSSYVGNNSPQGKIFLRLNADNIPPAGFDDETSLGGMALLGKADKSMLIPIVA